jgi:cytochrome c biogenesis protein CcmG/thiol:disulfide interchange protein DsbE
VKIIGVAYKDRPDLAAGFLTRLGNPYAENLADPEGRVGLEFGVTGPPETYAIDAQGVIRAKRVGAIDAATADELVAAARNSRPRS